MTNYRYVDDRKLVVVRETEDSGMESHSIEAREVKAYLAGGGVVDDPLPPTKEQQISEIDGALAALDLVVPRSVEDIWTLAAIDQAKIPAKQLATKAQKDELRKQRAALV